MCAQSNIKLISNHVFIYQVLYKLLYKDPTTKDYPQYHATKTQVFANFARFPKYVETKTH